MAARDFCGIKEASTQRAPPLPAISLRNAKAAINQSQQPRIFDRLSLQLPNQIADNLGEEQPWGCVSFPQDEGVVQRVEELDRVRFSIAFPTLTLPITGLDSIHFRCCES